LKYKKIANQLIQKIPLWVWAIFVIGIILVVFLSWVFSQAPLQSCVDTSMPVQTGSVINVPAGGSVQAAVDAAKPGDTIVLQAGATYTGPVVLKNKSGSGLVIRTSALSQLPAVGNRVGPQHAGLMAKIVSPGGNQTAMSTAPSAHHYRIIGVEFAKSSPSVTETNLVALGDFRVCSFEFSSYSYHRFIYFQLQR
jgi:hypothetical protein